jgi:YVTN family beta-propeller protein
MKRLLLALTAAGALLFHEARVTAENTLTLETKIQLGDIRGRIDHMAIDPGRHRLFVAQVDNDSVGVVDFETHTVIHVITDVKGPQGLTYVPSTDTLFVANGGDGSLRMFQGEQYSSVGRLDLGEDADNVRFDSASNHVLVSYGSGGLAIIDAASHRKINDIALAAHPQGFQLDQQSNRIYANSPKEQAVLVLDHGSGKLISAWETGNGTNYPLALDGAANHVLVVFRDPAKVVVYAPNGALVASVQTCGDADDMFVDAKRDLVYVSCGDGFVDVIAARGSAYQRVARIATAKGARTSLFVPEIDRLFVAARATAEEPAAVWVFRPGSDR